MLSVVKLSPGQEAYYAQSVAGGLEDYYAGRGEAPGIWHGGGAYELGLVGVVGAEQLRALVRAVDPLTGEQLRQHARARVTVDRIDPVTGAVYQVKKQLRPVAGLDLVFAAPKSVSLLHALGDERVRGAVPPKNAKGPNKRAFQSSSGRTRTYNPPVNRSRPADSEGTEQQP